jgi:hypothetical protein
MYSYCTLLTVTLIYLLFSIISIKKGKWYYFIAHPYAMFCIGMVFFYRYASEIPEISSIADRTVAVGFILVSLTYWFSYSLLKKEHVDYLASKVLIDSQTEKLGSPTWKLWAFIGFFTLVIITLYFFLYMKYGSTEYIFFTGHNNTLKKLINAGEFSPNSLWIRGGRYFTTYIHHTVLFFVVTILFEMLRRKSRIHGFFPILFVCIFCFITITEVFLITASRSFQIFFIMAILELTVISFLYSNRRLSNIAIPILFSFVIYSLFWLVTIQTIRNQGFKSTFSGPHAIFSKENFKKPLENIAGKTKRQYIPDKPTIPETQKIESLPPVEKKHDDTIKPINENKNKKDNVFLKEKEFLTSYQYSHATSKELAWTMVYFGRHREYLGILYPLRLYLHYILPLKSNEVKTVGNIILKERGRLDSNSETICGPFGDGYASYGYLGGYLNWCLIALICGVLGKFAVITLFTDSPRFEFTAFGVCIFVFTMGALCGHIKVFLPTLVGFFYLFTLCWLYKFAFITKKNRK